MAQKKFRITQKDFLIANRRAARLEEIEAHGRPIQMRTMTHRSKKVYDRNRIKRAAIKNDDSFFCHNGHFSRAVQAGGSNFGVRPEIR